MRAEQLIDTLKGITILIKEFLIFHRFKSRHTIAKKLILASEFAPAISGGVYRPAALAKYAIKSGFDVTVITSPKPATPSNAGLRLLEYIGPDIHIERYRPSKLKPSYRFFPQVDGGLLNAIEMAKTARRHFQGATPDTIIATGPAFTSFIAGYLLTRGTNSRLILDYRDEWTECPFDFVSKSPSDRRWERQCLKRASSIIVTTSSQRQHMTDIFGPEIGRKCALIPNGWEPTDTISSQEYTKDKSGRKILTFAGRLGGHTNPEAFLKTLCKILDRRTDIRSQITIRLVGTKTAEALRALHAFPHQEAIEIVETVPLADAKALMQESSALLLFHDHRFARYLPGKLYEYLASRKPILLIDDDGESDALIKRFNRGWSVRSDNIDNIENILSDITLGTPPPWKVTPRTSDEFDDWLAAHTREEMAKLFISLIS